jgi:hypothetical protein
MNPVSTSFGNPLVARPAFFISSTLIVKPCFGFQNFPVNRESSTNVPCQLPSTDPNSSRFGVRLVDIWFGQWRPVRHHEDFIFLVVVNLDADHPVWKPVRAVLCAWSHRQFTMRLTPRIADQNFPSPADDTSAFKTHGSSHLKGWRSSFAFLASMHIWLYDDRNV